MTEQETGPLGGLGSPPGRVSPRFLLWELGVYVLSDAENKLLIFDFTLGHLELQINKLSQLSKFRHYKYVNGMSCHDSTWKYVQEGKKIRCNHRVRRVNHSTSRVLCVLYMVVLAVPATVLAVVSCVRQGPEPTRASRRVRVPVPQVLSHTFHACLRPDTPFLHV